MDINNRIDLFSDETEVRPYAKVTVGLLQPIGGWIGRTAIERLQEIERKAIPLVVERMKKDWEKVCSKYIGGYLWHNTLSKMYVGQFPKILAYDQPFLSNFFKSHPDILESLINANLANVYPNQENPEHVEDEINYGGNRITVEYLKNAIILKLGALKLEYLTKLSEAQSSQARIVGGEMPETGNGNGVVFISTRRMSAKNPRGRYGVGGLTPGGLTPGGQTPGGLTPGGLTPGGLTPGGLTPGEQMPGEQIPGEQMPGEQTPGEFTAGEFIEKEFGLNSEDAEVASQLFSNLNPQTVNFLSVLRQHFIDQPDGTGNVFDVLPGSAREYLDQLIKSFQLSPGVDPSQADVLNRAQYIDYLSMRDILDKLGMLTGHRAVDLVNMGTFFNEPDVGAGTGTGTSETLTCKIDISIISLELYALILDIDFIENTVQTILDEAFEPLAEYYKFLVSQQIPNPELKYKNSPVGFIDLYKQHLYDCGNFLGPPIDHVWVPPHSSVQMAEEVSLTEYSSYEVENFVETSSERETNQSTKEDFLNEVQKDRESNFSFSQSLDTSATIGVFSANGTTNVGYDNRSAESSREVTNRVKEQSERVVERMKISKRTKSFRSTERTQINTKQRKIENPSDVPTNYEIRRKYQNIGVALHYVDSRLCWQLYIDQPASLLMLPELVHLLKPEGSDQVAPSAVEVETPEEITITDQRFPLRFNFYTDADTEAKYVRGVRSNDGNSEWDYRIQWKYKFKVQGIPEGFELKRVEPTDQNIGFGRFSPSKEPRTPFGILYEIPLDGIQPSGEFSLNLIDVNINDAQGFYFFPKITLAPKEKYIQELQDEANAAVDHEKVRYEKEQRRIAMREFTRARQTIIEVERSIAKRDSLDLRFEERTAVFSWDRRAV